jgi:DNA polymerase III alpha subunit
MDLVPLFKSHYSIGRSILNLKSPDDVSEDGADSIIDICVKNDLESFFLVDDSMSGFLEAYSNAQAHKLKFIFGLRISVCNDLNRKDQESLKEECKYVIFARNVSGYERLMKISSQAAKEGFYYQPRTDFKQLDKLWDNEDLRLSVPFYDSFIYKNRLRGSSCSLPPKSYELDFFIENNNLPFDDLLASRIREYSENIINTQSIYYKDKSHFKSYLTFRAIDKRTTLSKPNLDHMGSNEFCFESWKEKNEKKAS